MKRQVGVDFLRIVAMILIMMYHFVVHGAISVAIGNISLNMFIAKMMHCGGKIGVVLFYSVIIYMICYCTGIYHVIDIKPLVPFLSSNNWYATAYIIFLLFMPYMQILIQNISKSMHRNLAMLLVFLWSIVPTVAGYFAFSALNHATNLVWFFTIFIVTTYLKKYVIKNKIMKKVYLFGIVVLIYVFFAISILLVDFSEGGIHLCYNDVQYSSYFNAINSIPVVACSFALFFCCLGLNFKSNIVNNIIEKIASTTFGVYLIHDNPLINICGPI